MKSNLKGWIKVFSQRNSFLANEVFKTDIIDKKYKDKFNRKKFSKKYNDNLDDIELDDLHKLYEDLIKIGIGGKNTANNNIKKKNEL